MKQFVSVIIPHLNNLPGLKLCIESLLKQSYPLSNYELIVVDNGSTDEQLKSLKKLMINNFILLEENKLGSYNARNLGLKNTKGNIIAFTDSDCIPNYDWIKTGVNYLNKINNVGIVGGNIELFYKDNNNLNIVELYEKVFAFNQRTYIDKLNFSTTANLFTSISVIKDVGNFDETFKSSGDRDWCNRAHRKGYKIIYAENLVVKHPARNGFKEYFNKMFRIVGGIRRLRKKNGTSSLALFLNNLRSIIPPVVSLFNITKSPEFKQLKNFSEKIKVLLMFIIVRYLTVYENFRLQLGMEPRN